MKPVLEVGLYGFSPKPKSSARARCAPPQLHLRFNVCQVPKPNRSDRFASTKSTRRATRLTPHTSDCQRRPATNLTLSSSVAVGLRIRRRRLTTLTPVFTVQLRSRSVAGLAASIQQQLSSFTISRFNHTLHRIRPSLHQQLSTQQQLHHNRSRPSLQPTCPSPSTAGPFKEINFLERFQR